MAAVRLLVIDPPPQRLPAPDTWMHGLPDPVRLEISDSVDDARLRLARDGFDLVVVAGGNDEVAIQASLTELRALSPSLAIVVVGDETDAGSTEAIALRCGAHEWVPSHRAGTETLARAGQLALLRAHAAHATAMDDWLVPGQRFGSLGVLTSAAAHDISNMLQIIGGNVGMVLEDLPPAFPSRTYLEEVEGACQRASDLSRQMQTFSRTRRSGFERLSLGAVVREVNQLLRVARGRHIALRYDLQDDAPEVFADRALVSQMLVNLVMNACEAIGGQEGTVTIGVRAARLDAETASQVRPARLLDAGDYAALWITDSGAGMSAEVEGRAFDPLFSTKAEGRGLGLPASLRIAVSHGGGIRVDTAPAEGTTVTVYLPPHFSPSAV